MAGEKEKSGGGTSSPRERGRWRPGESGNPTKSKGREEADGLTEAQRARRITEQPRSADCNSQQRKLRRLYDQQYEKFLRLLTALEKAERERLGPAAGTGVASGAAGPVGLVDEGEDAVRELCGRILRRVGRLPPG